MKKVTIINTAVEPPEEMEALYNPQELGERVSAEYKKHRRLAGLPMLRYVQTQRQEFSVRFYIDDRYYEDNHFQVGEFRRFLSSLLYPVQAENGELKDPPEVLFIWSEFLSELCRVTDVQYRYTRFDSDLMPIVYTADVKLIESGLVFISSQGRRNDYLVLT